MKKAIISLRSQMDTYGKKIDILEDAYNHFFADFFYLVPICNYSKQLKEFLDELKPELIVLSGGEDIVEYDLKEKEPLDNRERVEDFLVQYGINNSIPIVGICRGMQFLNIFFGGKLQKIDNHVLRENGHEVEIIDQVSSKPLEKNKYLVNSYHGTAIKESGLATSLKTFALADSVVEGFYHREYPIFGVQWHPERGGCSDNLSEELLNLITKL